MKSACLLLLLCSPLVAQSAPSLYAGATAALNDATLTEVSSGPSVKFVPPNFNFGKQTVATTVTRTVTMTNTGNATLTISSYALLGQEPILTISQTCGSSLPAGASCSLNLTWLVSAGKLDGYFLEIADDAADSPQKLPIMGIGVGGE
jgi:trimeric autotransporter adhesin